MPDPGKSLVLIFLLTGFFLFPEILPAQTQSQPPVTYQYQQFLNTAKADLKVNLPVSFFSSTGQTLFRYQTLINKNNQHQVRDEFDWDFSNQIPVVDSFGVVTDIRTVSVFLDQEKKFSRSLEWAGTGGLFYRTDWQNTQAGYGFWLIEQNRLQETGPAFDLRHQSILPVSEWATGNVDLAWFNGTAGNRELDRKNLSFTIRDPDSKSFSLFYQRYQINRDYLTGSFNLGIPNLDYRQESSDRLGFQLTSPVWFDLLHFDFSSTWTNRTVTRKSELAGSSNPNYQVRSGGFENEISATAELMNWQLTFPLVFSSGDEKYSVLATNGLTGYNEEIQDQKLKKRNLATARIKLNPSVSFANGSFRSQTGAMVSKDQLFNPENNRYDDYDIVAAGIRQNFFWERTSDSDFEWEGDFQLAHHVFIHRDRSGDNFRNQFIRLAGTWKEKLGRQIRNQLNVQLSSQLRTYDYDARFISKKSFSFRVLSVEDSLSGEFIGQTWFLRGRISETAQGVFYAGPVKEYPVRHLSYYLAEPGFWIWKKRIAFSWRYMNQDQFSYQNGNWNLQQKIKQSGPVLLGTISAPWMVFSGDIWLMSRKLTGQKAEFLPSLTLNCIYEW